MSKKEEENNKNTDSKRKKERRKREDDLTSNALVKVDMVRGLEEQLMDKKLQDGSREESLLLVEQNETLQNQIHEAEKETMSIVEFMRKTEEQKDQQIEKLNWQLKNLTVEHELQKEAVVKEYQYKVDELAQKLVHKTQELDFAKTELKLIKEFRRKRSQMQKDLEEAQELMAAANQEYKDNLAIVQEKFANERLKLQQEANQKISQLTIHAHKEVLANLDETTKSVYKENVRINKALHYYMEEVEQLKRWRKRLEKENSQLKATKELDEALIRRKVTQSRHNKSLIKELQERVTTLEKALSLVVQEFEEQQSSAAERTKLEMEMAVTEVARLQKTVELKTKEMNKVKKLAKNILDQRTEVERFFLEGLETVKKEIVAERKQSHHDFNNCNGGVGTRNRYAANNQGTRANAQHCNAMQPEHVLNMSSKVDIADLTWEQKEMVLRYLFARMNKMATRANRTKAPVPPLLLPSVSEQWPRLMDKEAWLEQGDGSHLASEDPTFLTEAVVEQGGSAGHDDLQPNVPVSI